MDECCLENLNNAEKIGSFVYLCPVCKTDITEYIVDQENEYEEDFNFIKNRRKEEWK